jgi:hypothetical protein
LIPDLRRDEDNDQRMKYLHLAHSGARAAAHSLESPAVPRPPSYKVPTIPHEAPALGKSRALKDFTKVIGLDERQAVAWY